MTVKKSAVKQRIKYLLQKTLLPLCYDIGILFRKFDKDLVIFADCNSSRPPECQRLLMDELERRGYKCEARCCDFTSEGYLTILKYMCAFMIRYAQARTLVISNYFLPAEACKKRRGTRVVQLWHSCGIMKKFGYSSQSDISPDFHGTVAANTDLVTVSAPICEEVFAEAFALPNGVARAVGVSASDVFFDKGYERRCRNKLYENYPELKGKKLLLYLPTFRGDASFAYTAGHQQAAALADTLGVFVAIKTHPRVKDRIDTLPALTTDELMVCADMLITDYSSVIFEYALLDRPMLLWCPDLTDYIGERDFYIDIKKDIPCPVITDENALAQAVSDELENYQSGRYGEFVKKYMSACDGHSTQRIADIIQGKKKGQIMQ